MKDTPIIPCFLDRFNVHRYTMTPENYKRTVLRDISFLLNAFSHLTHDDMEGIDCERVKSSVLAYGLTSFAGQERGQMKQSIVDEIKNALYMFEPRLVKASINVTEVKKGASSEIFIKISGKLFKALLAEQVDLTLSFDVDTGHSAIKK
jgi:predicted component of type VI protein secretion system